MIPAVALKRNEFTNIRRWREDKRTGDSNSGINRLYCGRIGSGIRALCTYVKKIHKTWREFRDQRGRNNNNKKKKRRKGWFAAVVFVVAGGYHVVDQEGVKMKNVDRFLHIIGCMLDYIQYVYVYIGSGYSFFALSRHNSSYRKKSILTESRYYELEKERKKKGERREKENTPLNWTKMTTTSEKSVRRELRQY